MQTLHAASKDAVQGRRRIAEQKADSTATGVIDTALHPDELDSLPLMKVTSAAEHALLAYMDYSSFHIFTNYMQSQVISVGCGSVIHISGVMMSCQVSAWFSQRNALSVTRGDSVDAEVAQLDDTVLWGCADL